MPPGETVDELGGPMWLRLLIVFLSGLVETAMFLGCLVLIVLQELVFMAVTMFRTMMDRHPLNLNALFPGGPPPDPPPPPAYAATPPRPILDAYQQAVRQPAVSPEATALTLAREGARQRVRESHHGSASGSSLPGSMPSACDPSPTRFSSNIRRPSSPSSVISGVGSSILDDDLEYVSDPETTVAPGTDGDFNEGLGDDYDMPSNMSVSGFSSGMTTGDEFPPIMSRPRRAPFPPPSTSAASSAVTPSVPVQPGPSAGTSTSHMDNPGPTKRKQKKQRWFVVRKGTRVGVFYSWSKASEYCHGVSGAISEGFDTRDEAMASWKKVRGKAVQVPLPDGTFFEYDSYSGDTSETE